MLVKFIERKKISVKNQERILHTYCIEIELDTLMKRNIAITVSLNLQLFEVIIDSDQ